MASKVLMTRRIPEWGFNFIRDTRVDILSWNNEKLMPREEMMSWLEVNEDINGILCLLTDKIDSSVLDLCPNLKCVSTLSVGYNHIDLEECKKRNIRVGYTPDVLTNATAECAVSLLLSVARRFPEAAQAVKSGEWGTWKPEWMCGMEVRGSTVGVVGLGRIGTRFAEIMNKGFDCKIVYTSRTEKESVKDWATKVTLDELLEQSDFVVPHCSLNEDTNKMFNEEVFKKMKKTSIFINTTRGDVVDQDALHKALFEGWISAAGLDVTTPEPLPTESKLLELKNCLIVPHIGSATKKTRDMMAEVAVKNLLAGISGKEMVYEL